jgi:guanylate kinase
MRNVLVVISGPSGVGKGTIADIIKADCNMALSISCTTRQPRVGEVDGKSYFFISKEEFLAKISTNSFLEHSEHFENYYGTPKDFVLDKLKTQDVLLEIDVNGGLDVKKAYPDAALVMITPPSVEELKKRLIGRGTESLEKIENRISRVSYELDKQSAYDYVVVNDDLNVAVEKLCEIINKEKTILGD